MEYNEENRNIPPSPSSPSRPTNNNYPSDYVMNTKDYTMTTMSNMKHSFMSPLADMLNFGPACAKGRYNTELKAFEVIATCKFLQGEEVTFWYSDDCENVMIAN